MQLYSKCKGFSLVELLVVMSIALFISTAFLRSAIPLMIEETKIHDAIYDLQTVQFLVEHVMSLQRLVAKGSVVAAFTSDRLLKTRYFSNDIELKEGELLKQVSINDAHLLVMKLWNEVDFYDCAGVHVAANKWVMNAIQIRPEEKGYSLYCTSFSDNVHTVKLFENIVDVTIDDASFPQLYTLLLTVKVADGRQIIPLIFSCAGCR